MNPAAEARAKVSADHPEAVVVERRRNSIKHRLADTLEGRQRFALDVAIGPFHYGPDSDQEIDTALVPSTAPWDWEMTKAGFEVRALSDLSAGQVIEYRGGGESITFQPHALQYSNDLNQLQQISVPQSVAASVADDTLTWTDGYGPGLDFSWQVQTARLLKLLTINALSDLPTVDQFILDGGNPVLELNLIFAFSSGVEPFVNGQPWGKGQNAGDRDTQGLVEFRDGQGNILWWFNLPRSWDSEGNVQLGTFRFKKQGNSLFVTHRVPLSFVQNAVYPLMVDTTIDELIATGADDAHEADDGTGFDAANAFIILNDARTTASTRYNGGYRFTTVSIGQADTIDTAHWTPFVSTTGNDDPDVDILANAVDDASNFTDEADVTSRARTTASTPWDATGVGAGFVNSPEIKAVIQEVVDRGSWVSGNDLCILVDGRDIETSFFRPRSYEFNSSEGAKLHVEFTAVGGETRSLAGSQPAATGTLARIEQGLRALAGSQPSAAGTLAATHTWLRSLAGSQPASTGTLTRVEKALRALTGSQPTPSGTLTRVLSALRALGGNQPAPSGVLVRKEQALRAFAGDQPASSGTLDAQKVTLRALAGDQPAATGTLARRYDALRTITGNQPASSATLARFAQVARPLSGSQPAAVGVLARKEQALRAIAGSQPSASGALAAVLQLITLVPQLPDAYAILADSLADARAVAPDSIADPFAKEGAHTPDAEARRGEG